MSSSAVSYLRLRLRPRRVVLVVIVPPPSFAAPEGAPKTLPISPSSKRDTLSRLLFWQRLRVPCLQRSTSARRCPHDAPFSPFFCFFFSRPCILDAGPFHRRQVRRSRPSHCRAVEVLSGVVGHELSSAVAATEAQVAYFPKRDALTAPHGEPATRAGV